jgi:dihydroorotate dehydrogenase (fumarate)
VHQFYKRIGDKVDIIGCGGVSTAMDVFEHVLAGATAVQVGTLLMKKGPGVFHGLNRQLSSIMAIKEYTNLTEFKGKLKVKKINETIVQPL